VRRLKRWSFAGATLGLIFSSQLCCRRPEMPVDPCRDTSNLMRECPDAAMQHSLTAFPVIRRWVSAHHSCSPTAAALLVDMRLVTSGISPAERIERGTGVRVSCGQMPLMHNNIQASVDVLQSIKARWEGALLRAKGAVAYHSNNCGFVAGILAQIESPAAGEPPAYRLVAASVARPLPQHQLGSLPPLCRSVTPPRCTCAERLMCKDSRPDKIPRSLRLYRGYPVSAIICMPPLTLSYNFIDPALRHPALAYLQASCRLAARQTPDWPPALGVIFGRTAAGGAAAALHGGGRAGSAQRPASSGLRAAGEGLQHIVGLMSGLS